MSGRTPGFPAAFQRRAWYSHHVSLAHPGVRIVAVALVVVVTLTLVLPRRAEALEPLTIVAIATLVVVGVIIVVYLVVANVSGSRRAAVGEPRYVTCVESDSEARNCWALSEAPTLAPAVNNLQSP